MLCKKLNTDSTVKTIKGKFTNSDSNGFLYLDIKEEKKLHRNIINNSLAKLNHNYSKEKSYYRNYLYLQEIEYKIGEIYAAIYSPDKLFYRARLLKDLDYDKVVVNFIDFGNSEIIPKIDLAPLPQDVIKIEPMVMICTIPNIKVIDERRFRNIIIDLCQREINIKIEGRYTFCEDPKQWNNNCTNKDTISLISFDYLNEPIRSYLINHNIAVEEKRAYELISDGSISPCHNSVKTDHKHCKSQSTDTISNGVEYTKTVIIIHMNSPVEFYVHEFNKEVKNRLEYLQLLIARVVERYKSKIADNFFNKRNVYLTQFNEDKLWYRCKITRFDPTEGFLVEFLDFGNHEYKDSLSDLILLTADMGDDAQYLINEDPISHKCQLMPNIADNFPPDVNIKKYLTKHFVDPAKKVTINYHIKEDNEVLWLITNIQYREKSLVDLIKLQFIINEHSNHNKSHHSESVASSHSVHDAADVKVADYLLNGCIDIIEPLSPDTEAGMDSDRSYLVTYVTGLSDVWIDVGDGQTREMIDNLLSTRQTLTPVSEVMIDSVYGVQVIDDNNLLRCRAVDVDDNYIRVHLLDKGRTIKVDIEDLFHLSPEIISLPQQVLRFQLHSNLRLCADENIVNERLRSLIENQYVRIIRESPTSNTLIDLLIDNKSLVQSLLAANVACLIEQSNWFRSHQSRRHKCIQVSLPQIKNRDDNGTSANSI